MSVADSHGDSLLASDANHPSLSSMIDNSLAASMDSLASLGHLPSLNHTRTSFSSVSGGFGMGTMKMGAEYEGVDVKHHPTEVVYRMWNRLVSGSTENSVYSFFKANANVVSVNETCPPQILEHLYFHHLGVGNRSDTPPPPRPFVSVLGYWAHLVNRISAYCQNLDSAVSSSDKAWAYTTIDAMLELMGSDDAQEMCCLIMIQETMVMKSLHSAHTFVPEVDYILQSIATTLIPKYPNWITHMSWVKNVSSFDNNLSKAIDFYLECLEHGDKWKTHEVAPRLCMALLTMHQFWSEDQTSWFHTYNQISNKASVSASLCYFLYATMRTLGLRDTRIEPTFAYFTNPPLPWLRQDAKPSVKLLWTKSLRLAAITALDLLSKVVRLELECLEVSHPVSDRLYHQIVAANITMVAQAVVPLISGGKSTLHYGLARKVFCEITDANVTCPSWVIWQAIFDAVIKIDCQPYHKAVTELVTGWSINSPIRDQMAIWLAKNE
ncbi:hypothetical protein DIRU0_A00716 [Diutina rugosa]